MARTITTFRSPEVVNQTQSQPRSEAASRTIGHAPTIVLCPGQGSQHVGMGKTWAQRFTVAAKTFAAADAVLGLPLRKLCFEGPAEQLNRTDVAQAAIFTCSVACYRALQQQSESPPPTDVAGDGDASEGQSIAALAAVAGLSLGEFTALHLAGTCDFETGLRLVRLRGLAMQEAAEAAESGMVAVVGADESQAAALCAQSCALAGDEETLVPANFNCPGQVVVSGTRRACEQALVVAVQMGFRATPLSVAGAFHSPVMQPAVERLAEALAQATLSRPLVPVVCNVTALPHEDNPATIKRRLLEQLTSPVRWSQSMDWLLGNVAGPVIELAPGKVLSGLMRRIDRKVSVVNFAEPPG